MGAFRLFWKSAHAFLLPLAYNIVGREKGGFLILYRNQRFIPFVGGPFLGGLLGGFIGGAISRPGGFYRPYYPPYYYPPYPYYGPYRPYGYY